MWIVCSSQAVGSMALSSTSLHSLLTLLICGSVIFNSCVWLLCLHSPVLDMMRWPHYCSWDVTSFLMILPSHPICLCLLRQELELHTLPRLTLNSLCRLSVSPSIMASSHSSYHCLFIYRIVNTAWNQGRSELQLFFPFCTMLCVNLVILFYIILIPSWCCQICRIWLPSQEILSVLSKYQLPRCSLLVYTFVCLSMSSSDFAKRIIRNVPSLSFFQCMHLGKSLLLLSQLFHLHFLFLSH